MTCASDTQIYDTDYCYTYMVHWYTKIPLHRLLHFRLWLSSLHGCSVHSYLMITHHCSICSPHECTCMYCFYLIIIWLTDYCSMLPYSCYMLVSRDYYCYARYWILLFLLLIWIFPLLDMRAVDTWYVESHIYCSRFLLYCSRFPLYCSMLSTELRSSYHVTRIMYLFLWHCILDISDHKANLDMGETWRLIRSYRVDVWIHCLSHCRGRGSAGYRLLLMSIPLLF